MKDFEIIIGKVDDGFVAVSSASPYFCFEAPTEEAAIALAKEALEFYNSKLPSVKATTRRTPKFAGVVSRRKLTAKELEAA